ncbi:hypothetical protein AVEN_228551-1 [Araneus ventricosus]|uniref:Uncharacterized protein n=1 Tax=Araneus ventricosus TaxID=182803 RepID=A0A4Y2MW13_ARAVE|nr:hypothetical protein AVEN_228551-1 [Araneus ventricosus]
MLCWVPSHVGIVGNEQSGRAAKLAVAPMNITIPVEDLRKHINLLHSKWQEQWDSDTNNNLNAEKPLVEPWPSFTNRKSNTLIIRLCIGYT